MTKYLLHSIPSPVDTILHRAHSCYIASNLSVNVNVPVVDVVTKRLHGNGATKKSRQLHSSAMRRAAVTAAATVAAAVAAATASPSASATNGASINDTLTSPSSPSTNLLPFLDLLLPHARCIPARSDTIHVLHTPDEFYNRLLTMIQSADKRIILSSLYLGTGPHEEKLVDAIRQRLEACPTLQVEIVLDYLRATRPVGKAQDPLSSLTTLAPISSHPRVAISLLHIPPPTVPVISRLREWIEERYFTGLKTKEARGVHHMKFYVVDDQAIVSGANLSDTYFTTRQDRYILFQNAQLSDFYQNLTEKLKSLRFCRSVNMKGEVSQSIAATSADDQQENMRNNRDTTHKILKPLFQPKSEHQQQQQQLQQATKEGYDTFIFPTIQMGSLALTHDEQLTRRLFALRHTLADLSIVIATGYMNLTEMYENDLLNPSKSPSSKNNHSSLSPAPVSFIAASREANGWWGATGFGANVPELYASAAYELLESVKAARQSASVKLYEWRRDGWSYHAKGMWMTLRRPSHTSSLSGKTDSSDNNDSIILSMIGSPNYGARSVERDAESSLIIVTHTSNSLGRQLNDEKQRLMQHTKLVTLDKAVMMMKDEREVEQAQPPVWWIRVLHQLARPYM